MINPSQPPEDHAKILAELNTLLSRAKTCFQNRNIREAAAALHTAQSTAAAHNLHHEAAILRRALAILSTGGKPKLLTNPASTLTKK